MAANGRELLRASLADDLRDARRLRALGRVRHPDRDADRVLGTVESYVYPLLVFSQSVPKVAIAPLFVVWFGFGIIPKVISAFLLGFFPVVVSTVQGFKSVDPDMVDLARSMRRSRFQMFCAVSLPHALPAIFCGLKVSVTLAVVGAVVGEFVGSNSGIGYVLQRANGTFDLPTDVRRAGDPGAARRGAVLVVDRIERSMIPWHARQRQDIFRRLTRCAVAASEPRRRQP